MEVLIADLLVVAQRGEPVGDHEAVALSDLCQVCWAGVDTDGISIDGESDRTIQADASRLKQIFETLSRNVDDHGGDDGTVTVGELDGGFYLEGDGPGISEAARGDVFQVGYSTSEERAGFGLSIVKEIVDAHDWNITVTEGTAGGTRFESTGVEFVA